MKIRHRLRHAIASFKKQFVVLARQFKLELMADQKTAFRIKNKKQFFENWGK